MSFETTEVFHSKVSLNCGHPRSLESGGSIAASRVKKSDRHHCFTATYPIQEHSGFAVEEDDAIKPLYELLQERGIHALLVNSRDVRNVPARKLPTDHDEREGEPSSILEYQHDQPSIKPTSTTVPTCSPPMQRVRDQIR